MTAKTICANLITMINVSEVQCEFFPIIGPDNSIRIRPVITIYCHTLLSDTMANSVKNVLQQIGLKDVDVSYRYDYIPVDKKRKVIIWDPPV